MLEIEVLLHAIKNSKERTRGNRIPPRGIGHGPQHRITAVVPLQGSGQAVAKSRQLVAGSLQLSGCWQRCGILRPVGDVVSPAAKGIQAAVIACRLPAGSSRMGIAKLDPDAARTSRQTA